MKATSTTAATFAAAVAAAHVIPYGSSGAGSSTQIASELLKSMAYVNIVQIAYKGSGPAQKEPIAAEV